MARHASSMPTKSASSKTCTSSGLLCSRVDRIVFPDSARSSARCAKRRDHTDLVQKGSHGSHEVGFAVDHRTLTEDVLVTVDVSVDEPPPFFLVFGGYAAGRISA